MKSLSLKNKKSVYILSLLISFVLMGIFVNSFYWPYEGVSKRKLLEAAIVVFCVVLLPILSVKIDCIYKTIIKCICVLEDNIETIKACKKRMLSFLGSIVVGVGLSGIVTYVVSVLVMKKTYNIRMFYVLVALCFGFAFFCFMWKNAHKKSERIFVVVALIMGMLCIGVTPCRVGVSWDDEIHYARTLELSNAINGIMYVADEKNMIEYGDNIYARTGYDIQTDVAYTEELESLYDAKEWNSHAFSDYSVWSVAYIPSAIGIILGRGLGLSYTGVFNMGRIFNLLTYVCLIYASMKRLKYGKVLVAAVGLIPTTIFMASSYSYDFWVTGFTILGFSYFFAELQEDEPLTNKRLFIMIGALVLGCMPKAIYFPLLFPLLFMPKRKFANKKQRVCYYAAIIGGGLFLVATFMLPILVSGAGTGDLRGGSDVNSTEQIKFILKKPLAYAKILTEFLLHYISLGNAGAMLQRFAYVGEGYFYSTVSLLLAVLAFLDRGEDEKNHLVVKGTSLIGCAVAVVLSTTALYISFTAVASETVAGMQGRYLIPTIYPALYALGLGGNTHKINKNAFVCVPMIAIALTFVLNMVKWCVILY